MAATEQRLTVWYERKEILLRLTAMLLLVGLGMRLLRYLLCFPVWLDEAMLCLNLLGRDYAGLLDQLDLFQVAPIGFLWAQRAVIQTLGSGELALRLLPFLAGMIALLLFWRLATTSLSAKGAMFAVGFLAVARWPATMSANIKPYSLDLLFAVVALLFAAGWLRQRHWGWLAALALVSPLAVAFSYPSVLVLGGVALALLPAVWREQSTGNRAWYGAWMVLLCWTFLLCLARVGRPTIPSEAADVRGYMLDYWRHAFPPADPLAFLGWLAKSHTGQMLAYPVGEQRGGSTLTFLLCIAGAVWMWRSGRRDLLALCLVPFALNLAAAVARRYPYAASGRLTQHLAPAVCLLAGAGLAALLERVAEAYRGRWVAGWVGVLGVVALVNVVMDVGWPTRNAESRWSRAVAAQLASCVDPEDRIVVLQPDFILRPVLRWQLARLGSQVLWKGELVTPAPGGRLWVVDARQRSDENDSARSELLPEGWAAVSHAVYVIANVGDASQGRTKPFRCDVWACEPRDRPSDRPLRQLARLPEVTARVE